MSKVEKAVKFMEAIAADDSHGYSQLNRWGTPDYDCSSLVITAFEQAGFPVKSKFGASYTGNMKSAFLAAGFKDVTAQVNVYTAQGLQRGDVLLNQTYHTAVYCGNNKLVHAASDENRGIKGTKSGDQTGREIFVAPYANYHRGWDTVLRFVETPPIFTPQVQYKVETVNFVLNGYGIQMRRILKDNLNFVCVQDLLKHQIIDLPQYEKISAGKGYLVFLYQDLRYVKLADLNTNGVARISYDAATKTVSITK